MKLFLKEIAIIFMATYFIGELICRFLPIVSDIPERGNRDGFYLLKENQKGTYVKGKFPKWLKAEYSINNFGFNSTKDYLFNADPKIKIAVIGDSFVEGFQVDVTNSIGRLIEASNKNYLVYEFGLSGFNFFDYQEFYQKFDLKNFDKVFIILDKDDVETTKSEKTLFTKDLEVKEKVFRKIYNSTFFFKYLNFNHGIIRELQRIFINMNPANNFIMGSNKEKTQPIDIHPFIKSNPNIQLILKSKKDIILRSYYPELDFIIINEELTPIDFGFDKHWNLNGRKNVANTIVHEIEK